MDTWNQIENALCELEDRVEEALTPVNASECIRSVGHWTLYSSEHDRIACALETWETHPNRAEE